MIAEDLLERGLADLANEYDVREGATDHIRDQLAPMAVDNDPTWQTRLHRPTTRGWLVMAAAAIVIVVIASFAVGGGGGNGNGATPSAVNAEPAVGAAGGGTAERDSASAAGVPRAIPSPPPDSLRGALAHKSASGSGGSTSFGSVNGTTGSSAVTNGPVAPVPSVPDKVIKTGELDLQVKKGQVSATLNRLTGLATLERGYIADSRTSEGGFAPSGEVTLRVPVAAFDDTVNRARTITGVKVLSLQTSGKDVTSKYVDLKARINALQKTRATFLTLLSRATTIGETLAVQQHITDVQTQIEQLQGQKKVLVNQAALSTLTVTVDQKQVVEQATPRHHKSGLHKAFDRSVSRFVHGIEAIIGVIGPLLLALLLIAFFWFAGQFGYRVLRRRMV
jgi:hypothetical protein